MMQGEDRRDRNRKKVIHRALLDLLKEKTISEITIVELTEKADVNRKTFYNHYSDIYAVVQELEDGIVESLRVLLMKQLPQNLSYHSLSPAGMVEFASAMAMPFFTTVIHALEKSPDHALMVKHCEGHLCIHRKIAEMEKEILLSYMEDGHNAMPEVDYFVTFLVEGFLSVINRWLESGRTMPVENLAEFFRLLISGSSVPGFELSE